MKLILDLLYDHTFNDSDDLLRYLNQMELNAYRDASRCLDKHYARLRTLLDPEALEKFSDAQEEQDDFICRAHFRRGLILGIRLGSLR